MEEKYIKFYKTFHRKFKNNENLIHCSNLVSDGGVSKRSYFDQGKIYKYLTFVLHCRSDNLTAYPKKNKKKYKTTLSKMKITF